MVDCPKYFREGVNLTLEDQARGYWEQHYNCAQSVFAPFAERLGFDLADALRIATPFGGGMGHNSQVCGAVSGGLLVIGLVKGISVPDRDKKYACYALAADFQSRFEARHGALTCPKLLGYDIRDPQKLEQVRELGLFEGKCPDFVADAVRIVAALLDMDD